jgi:uncharacterized protein (DUF927 family)
MTERRKRGGKSGVAEAVRAAKAIDTPAARPKAASATPDFVSGRFEKTEKGLWKKRGEGDPPIWLCSAFEVAAETRDSFGYNWGFLLTWHDRDGMLHEDSLPRELFSGDCAEMRARLANGGLTFNGNAEARKAFAEYMNAASSDKRARSVSQIGWHKVGVRSVFVLPDRVYGGGADRWVLQVEGREQSIFNTSGTLMEWISGVSALCIGNSRLLFSVAAGFAAPLLGLLGEQGGGFNLCGAAQIGKSTALRAAASVWGGTPGRGSSGYVKPFRATGNGLEAVACMHCDTLLCLDEMGQVDSKEAGEIAYLLANGQAKLRSSRQGGSLRNVMRFCVLFLSTGEIGLSEKNREAGRETKAGQEVRLTDVPADAGGLFGLFEDLHDFPSPSAFANAVREATDRSFGIAAAVFLDRLTEAWKADEDLPSKIRDRCDLLLANWLSTYGSVSSQVRSIGFRFALVAVAGELASEWGVTGWPPGNASAGVRQCLISCLAERGTLGTREDEQAFTKLRDFISRHGDSRFAIWGDPRPRNDAAQVETDDPPAERFRTQHRAGWRRWTAPEGRGKCFWSYYLTPDGLKEALQGLNVPQAVAALVRRKCIRPDAKGKNARSFTVPHHGKMRLYEITSALFREDDEEPEGDESGSAWPTEHAYTEQL